MSLITNDKKQLSTINTEDTYKEIRCFIISAKQEIYKSVNSAMVEAYWNMERKSMRSVVKMTVQNMENKY